MKRAIWLLIVREGLCVKLNHELVVLPDRVGLTYFSLFFSQCADGFYKFKSKELEAGQCPSDNQLRLEVHECPLFNYEVAWWTRNCMIPSFYFYFFTFNTGLGSEPGTCGLGLKKPLQSVSFR